MKPPRYTLQAALEQRERVREERRVQLALALQAAEREATALRRAEEAKAEVERSRQEHVSHLYDPDPAGLLPMSLVQRRTDELRHLDGRIGEAARAIASQTDVLARATAAAEEARAALAEADREWKAVEKHKDAWLAEWKKAAERKEQGQAEEVVLARYAEEKGAE